MSHVYPVKFIWDHDKSASSVHVCMTSSSSGQSRTVPLAKNKEGFHEVFVKLPVGKFEYRLDR